MKIIALVSTFDDELVNAAIDSTVDLDYCMVFDGSTTASKNSCKKIGPQCTNRNMVGYELYKGWWKSDADKRTEMLKEAQALDEDAWGLWIDSDEILLFGQYLKDHCLRAEQETATGGTTIRIVEYDGSVASCFGKLIRVGAIRKYVLSSYEVILQNGMTVALPNVPICSAGGLPIGEISGRDDPILALNRPPVIGEPHLLHRHGLRNPERKAPRLHESEAEGFAQMVKEGGLGETNQK